MLFRRCRKRTQGLTSRSLVLKSRAAAKCERDRRGVCGAELGTPPLFRRLHFRQTDYTERLLLKGFNYKAHIWRWESRRGPGPLCVPEVVSN